MKYKTFVSIDVETTGLDPSTCEILEVGAVKFTLEGKILKSYKRRFKSHFAIPKEATAIHGITDAQVKDEKYYNEHGASNMIKSFCEGMPLVGHNVRFDLSFLKFEHVKIPDTFDTMGLYKDKFGGHRISLENACSKAELKPEELLVYQKSGITEARYHGAMFDCLQAMRLFLWLYKPQIDAQMEMRLEFKDTPKIDKPIIVMLEERPRPAFTTTTLDWPLDIPSVRNGEAIIPFGCDKKYHWWNGGQTYDETLVELKEKGA